MTKSEFQLAIDKIMYRHEANIHSEFEAIRSEFRALSSEFGATLSEVSSEIKSTTTRFDRRFFKIDAKGNWTIGILIVSVIVIVGILFKIISMFPTIPQ